MLLRITEEYSPLLNLYKRRQRGGYLMKELLDYRSTKKLWNKNGMNLLYQKKFNKGHSWINVIAMSINYAHFGKNIIIVWSESNILPIHDIFNFACFINKALPDNSTIHLQTEKIWYQPYLLTWSLFSTIKKKLNFHRCPLI